MTEINPFLSVITLNVNRWNKTIKKERLGPGETLIKSKFGGISAFQVVVATIPHPQPYNPGAEWWSQGRQYIRVLY